MNNTSLTIRIKTNQKSVQNCLAFLKCHYYYLWLNLRTQWALEKFAQQTVETINKKIVQCHKKSNSL